MIKNIMDQVAGDSLKDFMDNDKKLKEKLIAHTKAVPGYLSGQTLVQHSEAYVQ